MNSKREQIIRNLPEHHLVVRPENGQLTFLCYAKNQQLTVTLTEEEMKDLKWFESTDELYSYLKDEEDSIFVDANQLGMTFKIGRKEKAVSVAMNVVEMDKLKELKMTLKRISFEIRQNLDQTAECQERIREKEKLRDVLKEEVRSLTKLKQARQRAIASSKKSVKRMRETYNSMGASLVELTDIYDELVRKLKLLNGSA